MSIAVDICSQMVYFFMTISRSIWNCRIDKKWKNEQ